MDIRISPSRLCGQLSVPASKSCAHRSIICAALADGVSHLSGVTMSKDIEATIGAMTALGANLPSAAEISPLRVQAADMHMTALSTATKAARLSDLLFR